MKFDNDYNRPSLDLVMHVLVAAAFMAAIAASVDWSDFLAVLA